MAAKPSARDLPSEIGHERDAPAGIDLSVSLDRLRRACGDADGAAPVGAAQAADRGVWFELAVHRDGEGSTQELCLLGRPARVEEGVFAERPHAPPAARMRDGGD